jgi:hypothetical protein
VDRGQITLPVDVGPGKALPHQPATQDGDVSVRHCSLEEQITHGTSVVDLLYNGCVISLLITWNKALIISLNMVYVAFRNLCEFAIYTCFVVR